MRLELDYPIKPFSISQHFGENIPCVKFFGTDNQVIVDGKDNNTCPVGFTKLYAKWGMDGHNGTDVNAGVQPVYSAYDGVVIEQQLVPARGLGLAILSQEKVDMDCGTHYAKLRYWHLKSFTVNIGDTVKKGQQIGVSNSTGYSSGNHLHFELQPMDKDKGGHPYLVNPEGSISGAVSVEPYFTVQKPYQFFRDLFLGSEGEDVKQLQILLNKKGYMVSQMGTGSLGNEGTYFGPKTLAALAKYQKANNIKPSLGYFGPKTRSILNGG